jgi:hypothetical protein
MAELAWPSSSSPSSRLWFLYIREMQKLLSGRKVGFGTRWSGFRSVQEIRCGIPRVQLRATVVVFNLCQPGTDCGALHRGRGSKGHSLTTVRGDQAACMHILCSMRLIVIGLEKADILLSTIGNAMMKHTSRITIQSPQTRRAGSIDRASCSSKGIRATRKWCLNLFDGRSSDHRAETLLAFESTALHIRRHCSRESRASGDWAASAGTAADRSRLIWCCEMEDAAGGF